jgi:hypothetical protein
VAGLNSAFRRALSENTNKHEQLALASHELGHYRLVHGRVCLSHAGGDSFAGLVAPAGYETVVKIIAPEDDYWLLPCYLRRFKHLRWYGKLPDDPYASIVVVSSKLDARMDEKSDRKWIMAGLTEMRPGIYFELYVELELWKKYVETLPRERE